MSDCPPQVFWPPRTVPLTKTWWPVLVVGLLMTICTFAPLPGHDTAPARVAANAVNTHARSIVRRKVMSSSFPLCRCGLELFEAQAGTVAAFVDRRRLRGAAERGGGGAVAGGERGG